MINDTQLHLQFLDPQTMTPEGLLCEIAQLPPKALRVGAQVEDRRAEFRLLRQITPRDAALKMSCFAKQDKFGLIVVCPTKGRLELSGIVQNGKAREVTLSLGQIQVRDVPQTISALFDMIKQE